MLPANFRKVVSDSSDGRYLFLSVHPKLPCLTGFGESRIAELRAKIDLEEERALIAGRDYDRDAASINLGSMIESVSFDASGRFIFPAHLRDMAEIGAQAVFFGSLDEITIWNPDVLMAQDAKTYAGQMMLVQKYRAELEQKK